MRVVGGALRGRRLSPPPPLVRPTADRVRESTFAVLGDLTECRVLDLYAGTGALGIEALSRGATSAVFVDCAKRSLAVVRRNLADLGLEDRATVVSGDAPAMLARLGRKGQRFDLLFLDPPYRSDEAIRALAAVSETGTLARHGVLVLECATRHPVPAQSIKGLGFRVRDERRYGETTISQLVLEPSTEEEPVAAAASETETPQGEKPRLHKAKMGEADDE